MHSTNKTKPLTIIAAVLTFISIFPLMLALLSENYPKLFMVISFATLIIANILRIIAYFINKKQTSHPQ